jgi:pimeloyl-ACP methyl ester carboxylesterase
MRWGPILLTAVCAALLATAGTAFAAPSDPPPGANDFGCVPSAAHPRPVVLTHGLGANMRENWQYISPALAEAGYCVFALTYGVDERTAAWPYRPGGSIPMQESARELHAFVEEVLHATGAAQVDIVGHSEGTVMPRYYLERLGGAPKVARFVALTPLWRGTNPGGTATARDLGRPYGLSQPAEAGVEAFCASCTQFLTGSDFLNDLNSDGEAIPGIEHTSIVTRYDELATARERLSSIVKRSRDQSTDAPSRFICSIIVFP